MSGYPQGEILLARCRAGLGKIVIVEGESDDQDPYFYNRWFGDRARELTFLPQNGCERVVQAVAELRAALGPTREVYGIRDRDFCEDADVREALPGDGVLRPGRYTLENYLLEPEGWFEVVRLVHRGAIPAGWDSLDAVTEQIVDAYRRCLPVAAFNWTVQQEYARLPADPTGACLGYRQHPQAIHEAALAQLDAWGRERAAIGSLRDVFAAELDRLGGGTLDEWQRRVTGKAVLKVFHAAFPGVRGVKAPALLDNLYINTYPRPPDDLEHLIDRLLQATP